MRYEKTVDGQTINHVWDGNQQIVADVIDNQFYEADCYIRGTNLVAKYNYWNGDKSEYTYYTQNAHGDVVNLTDKDGKVTKSYRYDAFGVEKDIDKNDTNAFRYCGEYYDKETATVYLRARNYNPSTGRFISRDSFAGNISDPLSLNLYTYCANNPVYYSDPTGHFVIETALAMGAVSAAALAYGCGLAAAANNSHSSFSLPTLEDTKKSLSALDLLVGGPFHNISSIANDVLTCAKSINASYEWNLSSQFTNCGELDALRNGFDFNPSRNKIENFAKSAISAITISSSISKSISKSISQKKSNKYNVYLLYDEETNQIEYVGRTVDLKSREGVHKKSLSRGHLTMLPIATNLSYEAARGLEELGIEYYNTYNPARYGGTVYNNQIHGISLMNPLRIAYLNAAIPYISKLADVMYNNDDNVMLSKHK